MAKPTTAQVQSAITYFMKEYQNAFDKPIRVNRNTAKWGIEAILADLSMDELKELIIFYFATGNPRGHDMPFFLNNYDKLLASKEELDADKKKRQKMREESAERARKWKEKHGYKGIADA